MVEVVHLGEVTVHRGRPPPGPLGPYGTRGESDTGDDVPGRHAQYDPRV